MQVSASVESLDSNEVVTAMALDEYVLNMRYISVEQPTQLTLFDMQLGASVFIVSPIYHVF